MCTLPRGAPEVLRGATGDRLPACDTITGQLLPLRAYHLEIYIDTACRAATCRPRHPHQGLRRQIGI